MRVDKDLLLDLDETTSDPLDYKGSVKQKKLQELQDKQAVKKAQAYAASNVAPITSVTEIAPIDSYWEKGETLYDLQQGQEEYLAKQQGSLSKVANTVGQGVGTFLTATMSSLASIGGGLAALGAEAATGGEAQGMDIMLNNPIMQGISQLDKYIKEDLLPTYYTQEQQNSLLSAATATDAINGLGFLLSNILPGLAVTKALGGVSKIGSLAKLGKLEQVAEKAVKMGTMKANEASKLVAFGNFMKNVPAVTGAVVGRLGESAMEANGIYEELIANGVDEVEAKKQRDNVFYGNMALAASDLAQFTRWFKPNPYELIVKQGAGYGIKKLGKKELIGSAVKEAIQEGSEEGYQFLLGQGAKKDALDQGDNFISNVIDSAGDAFTTIEGQKSMLLGAVLGAGAGTVFKAKNAKQLNEQLNSLVSNLNANPSISSDRYIKNAEGQYVLNPAFVQSQTTISKLELQKQAAIAEGKLEEAELIEKLQMAELVTSRVEANKFEDLIEEFETLGKADEAELEQYFGTIPTDKEGTKLTAREIADQKIAEAKQMKKMIDGINLIPQFQSLIPEVKSYIARNLLTQDSLGKQIIKIDSEIAELNIPTYTVPITTGVTKEAEPKVNPVNEKRIKELEQTKQILVDQYNELNDKIKQFTAKPESIVDKVVENQTKQQENFEKKIEDEIANKNKQNELVDDAVKNKEEVTVQTPEGEIVTKITGVNPETGQIETEAGIDITPDDIIAQKAVDEEEPEQAEAYDYEDADTIFQGPKKVTIYSTSTSAQVYDNQGRKIAVFTGSPWNELQYQFRDEQYHIVKYMADPANTPSKTKTYTAQLNLRPITEDLLKNINSLRAIDNLPALSMEELNSVEYMPIGISIYENGKLASADITPFHDIDYFRNIARFDELSPEDQTIVKEQFKKERQRIIDLLKKGTQVKLKVENKSNGIPNYNPPINGKRQVNPINEIFSVPLLGRTSGTVPVRGLGVVTEVSEDTYEITFENGSKQTYALDAFTTIQPVKGKVVFETVSANNSPYLLDAITFNEVNAETQQAIATLFTHRLFNGNEIKLGKTSFDIIAEGTGLLNNLVYLGERKSAREKQIFFKKDGTLVVGKKEFTSQSDPADVKDAVFNHLTVHHKYPKYPLGAIRNKNKIILPTEIDDNGVVTSNIPVITMERYLFGATEQQPNPLIGTNINSNVNFINSYFSYAKGPDGLLELTTNEPKEKPKPFAEDLSKESTKPTPTAPVSGVEKSIRIANLEITQKVNSKGNIEREIKNVDNDKSLLNVITPEGKSMFFSLPNLNEAIDNQSQAVKDVIGNVDITKELKALETKPTKTIENVTETAKELNKDCNGVGGNKPIEKGPGGGIDLNDMFK